MTNFKSHGAKGVARTGAALAAAGIAALALASPASAKESLISEKPMWIDNCNAIGSGQFCPSADNIRNFWPTTIQFTRPARVESVKVEFTADPKHCSDIIAHVFFDGKEWGSHIVHPGQTDGGGYEIPVDSGIHQVKVQAEGVPGGCNTGFLSSWGGVLRVYALT